MVTDHTLHYDIELNLLKGKNPNKLNCEVTKQCVWHMPAIPMKSKFSIMPNCICLT